MIKVFPLTSSRGQWFEFSYYFKGSLPNNEHQAVGNHLLKVIDEDWHNSINSDDAMQSANRWQE